MTTFGTRLRTERTRLALTQPAMGKIGGVNTNTQGAYEKDSRSPTADYLLRVAAVGVDLHYLFYGNYLNEVPSRQVAELLALMTQLPPEQQAASYAMMTLFRRANGQAQTSAANADAIWRAARIFELFLTLPEQGRFILDAAAKDLLAATAK